MTEDDLKYGKKADKKKGLKEKAIKFFFLFNGLITVVFIFLIFLYLIDNSIKVFETKNITDFLFNKTYDTFGNVVYIFEWFPTSEIQRLSFVPLFLGTILTAIPATLISVFFGISIGIYLSEIARPTVREILKPIIEMFIGIPTVVVGFILLSVGATIFQDLFLPTNRLNAFLASLGLSLIVTPIIASITEDALRTVPAELRTASYSLGATKWQTISRIIIPASLKGISAGVILGFGRAIGETMIVLMATGNAAVLTVDIFSSVRTMTATIAAELGEVSHDSLHYYSLFFIGAILFITTFILNLLADLIFNNMRKRLSGK